MPSPAQPDYTGNPGIFDKIRRQTRTSLIGEVFPILSRNPHCLESFLGAIDNAIESCRTSGSADVLMQYAMREARSLWTLSNHLKWLSDQGFSREDIRQIRYVIESFCNSEAIWAVITAAVMAWGKGELEPREYELVGRCGGFADFTAPIEWAAQCEFPSVALSWLTYIREHSFTKAISVWPEYADKVWSELSESANEQYLEPALGELYAKAKQYGGGLIQCAADADIKAECSSIVDELDKCLDVSCRVLLVSCAIREMFIRAEAEERA